MVTLLVGKPRCGKISTVVELIEMLSDIGSKVSIISNEVAYRESIENRECCYKSVSTISCLISEIVNSDSDHIVVDTISVTNGHENLLGELCELLGKNITITAQANALSEQEGLQVMGYREYVRKKLQGIV